MESGRKVALITIGDSRREFYQTRISIVEEETRKVLASLERDFDVFTSDIIYDEKTAIDVSSEIRRRGIKAVIIFYPIWGTPSLSLRIAQATDAPVAILGNRRTDSSSLVVMLTAAGMLDQMGIECRRIAGDLSDDSVYKEISDYIIAASLIEEVKNSCFCMLGGRSIGIGTTVADPSQWGKIFGVSFDHRDQYEIFYRAEAVEEERVNKHLEWWKDRVKIEFGGLFTPASLEKQMRGYLAVKDIVQDGGYDFLGLKCQQEMSDHYALQCLAVALLNNNEDADGPKKPVPVSCECDADGALTMRILSLASGGQPSCLVDIKYFSDETKSFILANCGSLAPYFGNPDDSRDSYSHITMMQHSFGLAGGGATQFIAAPGHVTVARLFRSNGEYVLGCFEGETEMKPIEELRKTSWCYPHAFIKADVDYDLFFRTMNSNHLHLVYGSYSGVLRLYAESRGIKFISYNRKLN